MGRLTPSANTYRRMLIERQIIGSTALGYATLSILFMWG